MSKLTSPVQRVPKFGFKIGHLEVRPVEGEILGPDGGRHVQPKAMEVLTCLAQKPGHVFLRNEILDQVWGHRYGSDSALTRCISELRQALDDRDGANHIIETIPKRGYRLAASTETTTDEALSSSRSPNSNGKQSIAVLPFRNLSGDPEQEYFSDGITEDIITDLSRISDLFVIARNSTFTFKGKAATAEELGKWLGARYILEGSVRREWNRIRVVAQLTDSHSGSHVWADRYDRDFEDVFALQDDLTQQIVSVLAAKLTSSKETRVFRPPVNNMEAYEYFLRGKELAYLHKRETGLEARRLLERAITLDPKCAPAYAWLAMENLIEYVNQWGEDPDESLLVADELAQQAVKLDEANAEARFALGECSMWARRAYDQAMDEANRAIALNPNYSDAFFLRGHVLHYTGRSEESLEPFAQAMRLDPYYPDIYLHFVAQSCYTAGRYEDAIDLLKSRLVRHPDSDISHVLLAASFGRLGDTENAAVAWAEALSINPSYSLEDRRRILPYKDSADFEDFLDGLRQANLVD